MSNDHQPPRLTKKSSSERDLQRDCRRSITITTHPDLPEQLSADSPEDNRHDKPKGGACNRGEEEESSGKHERDVSQAEEDGPSCTEHDVVEARFEVSRGIASFAVRVAIAVERAIRGMLSTKLRWMADFGQRTG